MYSEAWLWLLSEVLLIASPCRAELLTRRTLVSARRISVQPDASHPSLDSHDLQPFNFEQSSARK